MEEKSESQRRCKSLESLIFLLMGHSWGILVQLVPIKSNTLNTISLWLSPHLSPFLALYQHSCHQGQSSAPQPHHHTTTRYRMTLVA